MAVGGYDGMRPDRTKALKATNGEGGEALLDAMKGQIVRKPARPGQDRSGDARHRAEHLHPQGRTRRRQLYNVEFETMKAVKDPGKTK